jgi:hypothetical protein
MEIVSSASPETVNSSFETLTVVGSKLARSLLNFVQKIRPVLMCIDNIFVKRAKVCELLEFYQKKMAKVRKGQTEKRIEKERIALLNFVASLKDMNQDSNNVVLAVLTLYAACCKQLVYDLSPVLDTLCSNRYFEVEGLSNEEIELDQYIRNLQAEISASVPVRTADPKSIHIDNDESKEEQSNEIVQSHFESPQSDLVVEVDSQSEPKPIEVSKEDVNNSLEKDEEQMSEEIGDKSVDEAFGDNS